MRLNVATMLRRPSLVFVVDPVARILNVPVFASIMVASALLGLHWLLPLAGSSSIVYWAVEPGTVRHVRGSAPFPFHAWLTALGDGTPVQYDQ